MPDLHLDPERLRGHALVAAELAEALDAVLRDASDHDADGRRLCAEVRAAARELTELSSALTRAAAEAGAAEDEAARALRFVEDRA